MTQVTVPATATASPTASTAPADGDFRILAAVPFPHPGAVELRVQMDSAAEALRLELYSPAMVLLDRVDVGALAAGWNRVPLPVAWHIHQGLSFVRLTASRGGQQSPPFKPLRLVQLR